MAQAKMQHIDIFDAPCLSDDRSAGLFSRDATAASTSNEPSSHTLAYTRPRRDTFDDTARLQAAREEISLLFQAKTRSQLRPKKPNESDHQRLRELFEEQTQRHRSQALTKPLRAATLRPQPDYNDPRLLRLESRALLDAPDATFSNDLPEGEGPCCSIGKAELEWLSTEERGYKACLAAEDGQSNYKRSAPRVINPESVRKGRVPRENERVPCR